MLQLTTRERIFQEAIRLFGARGYRETTVGDIEAAAGLTRRAGGFYRHFTSKEAVVIEALERMSNEMIADIRLEEVLSLKSPRAELLVIARSMLKHAEDYRPLRLVLGREAHRSPAIKRAAHRANSRLAQLDVLPWMKSALRNAGKRGDAKEHALMIFGPIVARLIQLDRGDKALDVDNERFLARWADHWADWLADR